MGRSDSTQSVRCRHCQTENEAFYTYCRACLETLPSESSGGGRREPRRRDDKRDS